MLAFVTDFDGTITHDDFFHYVIDAYFDISALEPWRLYLDGQVSHFEALKRIYGALRASETEITALAKKIKVDEWVLPTFELLHNAQVPIYIASAGCDFYINLLFGETIAKYGIQLITNPSSYSQADGLVMDTPPTNNPYYDKYFGISKKTLVQQLQNNGKQIIFAGDGPPDIEPARVAEVVFAKKMLLDLCKAEGIKTKNFDGFKDIYSYFESELQK